MSVSRKSSSMTILMSAGSPAKLPITRLKNMWNSAPHSRSLSSCSCESPQSDVADRAAAVAPVGAAVHAIGGVALDSGDRAVGADGVDDADVLVPDDQVAGLRRHAGAGGHRLAGALGPGPDVVHAAEALAGLAERHAGFAGGPGDEVGTP